MAIHSRVEQGEGRRRAWTAPNGQKVVLPLLLTAWETDELTGEVIGTTTARVELVDGRPQTVMVLVEVPDGIFEPLIQKNFRWATPGDLVRNWIPEVLARGEDPLQLEPPTDLWSPAERQELSHRFLEEIAEQHKELGYGYANVLAAKYRTTPRTVRSWVERAKQQGIIERSSRRTTK